MKRFITLIITGFMALCLTACGNGMDKKVETDTAATDTSQTEDTRPADATSQETTPAPTTESTQPAQ